MWNMGEAVSLAREPRTGGTDGQRAYELRQACADRNETGAEWEEKQVLFQPANRQISHTAFTRWGRRCCILVCAPEVCQKAVDSRALSQTRTVRGNSLSCLRQGIQLSARWSSAPPPGRVGVLGAAFFVGRVLESTSERREVRLDSPPLFWLFELR